MLDTIWMYPLLSVVGGGEEVGVRGLVFGL